MKALCSRFMLLLLALLGTATTADAAKVDVTWPDGYKTVYTEKRSGRDDVYQRQILRFTGLLDPKGREILPKRYHGIRRVDKTSLFIFGERKPSEYNVRYGLLDASTGKIILPTIHSFIEVTRAGYIRHSRYVDGRPVAGLIDTSGKTLLTAETIEDFSIGSELAVVQTADHGWWVDRNLQPFLADRKYARVYPFVFGSAIVADRVDGKLTNFRYVDRTGKERGAATDPTVAANRAAATAAASVAYVKCQACNGNGGRYEDVQQSTSSYADIGGRPSENKVARWTEKKRVGNCFTCEGSGRVEAAKK